MARKKKEPRQGPTPARDDVRRAWRTGMLRDANFLNMVINGLQMYLDGDQVTAMGELERKHIRKAKAEVKMAQKRMRAVAKKLDD